MWRLIGILTGEQPLRRALADDDDRLAAALVVVVEVAAGDQRNAQRRKEARRNHAKADARIFFARALDVAFAGDLEARAQGVRRRAREPACPGQRDPRRAVR